MSYTTVSPLSVDDRRRPYPTCPYIWPGAFFFANHVHKDHFALSDVSSQNFRGFAKAFWTMIYLTSDLVDLYLKDEI